jgi:MYXO-CTERM domain-containing protein
VTHGFLRSLANLELEKSVIGRFAPHDGGPREESVTVGDTPWPVVGGLLAVAAAALALIRRSSR